MAGGHAEVTAIGELLISPVDWRNPVTGEQRQIVVYGFDPQPAGLICRVCKNMRNCYGRKIHFSMIATPKMSLVRCDHD